MKKYLGPLLLILMSLALLGLLLIQGYWLRQSFSNGLDEFNGRVVQAMESTAKRIEEAEIRYYYDKFGEVAKKLPDGGEGEVINTEYRRDSVNEAFVYLSSFKFERIAIPLSTYNNDSLILAELSQDEQNIRILGDTTQTVEPLTKKFEKDFSNADLSVRRLARRVSGNTPIEQRIAQERLDSLLQNELTQKQIKTPKKFAILNSELAVTNVHSPDFDSLKAALRVPLFYDSQDNPTHYLTAYFPEKRSAIFQPFLPVFILTIAFTLLIIGVFGYTLYQTLRLGRLSQIKTDFINNMTHEFKTPIATINVATDALRNPKILADQDRVKYYSELIKQENKRMNSQVETILRIGKLERNQSRLNRKIDHLNDLLTSAVDAIRLLVEENGGTIFEHYTAKLDKGEVDSFHLENVFVNILDNAYKYSKEKPKISVKTWNEANHWVMSVTDEGIGMNQQELKKIFDQFYRAETGNIHNVKGHGLGLAYVKKIVQMHGGKVKAESTPGQGSTFKVSIPL